MSEFLIFLPIILNFIQFFIHLGNSEIVIEYSEDKKPCTYFGKAYRLSKGVALENFAFFIKKQLNFIQVLAFSTRFVWLKLYA